jgi:hypothetical protein
VDCQVTTDEASDENAPTPEDDDKSALAFKELIRVLEAAVLAGVEAVGLEWRGDDLLIFHENESVGKIAQSLTLEVIAEIVKRAQIGRKHKGTCDFPSSGKNTAWPSRNTTALVNPPTR